MTGLQIYAIIVLPLGIAAGGWAYAYYWVRHSQHNREHHPGE